MAYSIKKNEIIQYPPATLRSFVVSHYEWIDNLNFALDPHECLENADEYISIVKEIFLKNHWDGDGDIELMWIPPFVLHHSFTADTRGEVVWHVKQQNDGISFLLGPEHVWDRIYALPWMGHEK